MAPRALGALALAALALLLAAAAAAAPVTAAGCAASTFAAPLTRACTLFEAWSGASPPRAACACPGRAAGAPTRAFALTVATLVASNPVLGGGATKTYVAANGTVPGPAIVVDEGDWVEVTVTNGMDFDATTLHWHGQTQVLTPFADGVPSMTQCPIPPGASMTYAFRASNAGTFWWHGHLNEQYVDGLVGLLQVRAPPGSPAAPPAHTDEVTLILADFYSQSAHGLVTSYYLTPASGGNEPVPDAITVNGAFSATLAGAAPEEQLFVDIASRTGKTLFHVVAANAFSMFTVSIDGVNLQVVELDSTAVRPLTVPQVMLNVAQRVSFVVDWSTLPAAFASSPAVFLRVTVMDEMLPFNVSDPDAYPSYSKVPSGWEPLDPNFVGVLQFAPVAGGRLMPAYNATAAPPAPTPPAVNSGAYAGVDVTSLDTNLLDARPVLAVPAPPATHEMYLEVAFFDDDAGVNRAHFNGISHTHDMAMTGMLPALYKHTGAFDAALGAGEAPAALTLSAALPGVGYGAGAAPPAAAIAFSPDAHYVLPTGAVVSIFINNTDGGEHPMHIHGHSFFVVASSARPDAEAAFAGNQLYRDVVSVAAGGWVKLLLVADNPGVWALHCHIDFHLAAGLMVELFEDLPALAGLAVPPQHLAVCGLAPAAQPRAAAPAAAVIDAATATGLAAAVGVLGAGVLALGLALAARAPRGGGKAAVGIAQAAP